MKEFILKVDEISCHFGNGININNNLRGLDIPCVYMAYFYILQVESIVWTEKA